MNTKTTTPAADPLVDPSDQGYDLDDDRVIPILIARQLTRIANTLDRIETALESATASPKRMVLKKAGA